MHNEAVHFMHFYACNIYKYNAVRCNYPTPNL